MTTNMHLSEGQMEKILGALVEKYPASERMADRELDDLIMRLRKNIKREKSQMPCRYCSLRFKTLDKWLMHVDKKHYVEKEADDVKWWKDMYDKQTEDLR